MFYVLFTILNFVIVSKINLQWSCLLPFSYPPLQAIQVGKTMSVWNVLTLWNSKNIGFCVCESKSYILAVITMKNANKFC